MDASAGSLRGFLRGHYQGAIAVLAPDGSPYTAVVHYACDHYGVPYFLFSNLAVHQQYLHKDPRASFLLWEPGDDLMELPRMALQGEIHRVHPDPALEGRLLCLLPGADGYRDMPDFHFYRLDVKRIRWIAGFGSMGWAEEVIRMPGDLRELELAEAGAVAHMNADHGENLRDYWRHFGGEKADAPVRMLALDAEGADLQAGSKRLRLPFSAPVQEPKGWRQVLVDMARQARGSQA
ncbi:HugZ family protein [Acidithiobacillus sp. IBUN Pt1247-S3]|uniref:HugZ family pyridoxamine 5'-phosphate oxidase n=1 Tax=Acidithiobacillus sp. IBUN Pt1247-S3 TaxID=3166642 RepID=UPI0034E508BC